MLEMELEDDYRKVCSTSTENLYSVAKWVRGVIKNTELQKLLQIVDFWNKEKQCEIRIKVGDYVIKKENQQFEVMSQKEFNETYRKII